MQLTMEEVTILVYSFKMILSHFLCYFVLFSLNTFSYHLYTYSTPRGLTAYHLQTKYIVARSKRLINLNPSYQFQGFKVCFQCSILKVH